MKSTKNIILISVVTMAMIIFALQFGLSLLSQQNNALMLNETILANKAINEAQIISEKIGSISENARVLALLIGNNKTFDFEQYDQFIYESINKNQIVFGMGYWFEPFYIDKSKKYYGPYIYKNDETMIEKTYMYSNEEYDYFNKDWYKNSINSDKLTAYSKPFYDEYLDTLFLTAAVKIIDDYKQVGVVSIDITLREIEEYLNELSQEKEVSAYIVTENGDLWGSSESLEVETYKNITNIKNTEIQKLSSYFLDEKFENSVVLDDNIFVWSNIGDTSLKLILGYPKAKIMRSFYLRKIYYIGAFILALLVFILLINLLLIRMIEKPLMRIIYENAPSSEEEVSFKCLNDKSPNFDNMIKLIQRLFEEREHHIDKLNENNSILYNKNEEIEALYNQTDAMNKTLTELLEEIKNGYIVTVRSLSNAIEAKDKYTQGHCENVTKFSLGTAKILGLKGEDLDTLEYASLLHDVGKIGIPSSILNKPSKLNNDEFEIIKSHPTIGYNILKDIEFLKRSALIVYQHHERCDGLGYPRGLTKNEIDILTRIVTVTDAYDAMTSARPYRKKPLSHDKAMEILIKNSGTQFDKDVVNAFRKYLKELDN